MTETRERPRTHAQRALAIIFAIALGPARLTHAQVFELSGGDSSLYDAAGSSLSMRTPGSTTTIGAGMVAGHFHYGASMEKMIGSSTLVGGDNRIDFRLPTDVFDANHYLYGRGIGIRTRLDSANMFAFAGTVSTFYETPVFEGAASGGSLVFFSLRDDLSTQWNIHFDMLLADKLTEIEAVEWRPVHEVEFALAGGLGADQPYGAGSVKLSRPWIDVTASYIAAGKNFRRVLVSSPLQAEPDKGNLLLTLRPTHYLTLSGGTQSYLVPDTAAGTSESSTVRSVSSFLQVRGAAFSGTAYDSSAMGVTSHAAVFTGGRDITGRMKLTGNYMVSKPKGSTAVSSLFTTVTETLNQHVSANESISTSNGQTGLLYGGSLLTNLLTFSANYETFYVPIRASSPFQQSLLVDVSLHLFGAANLHGATFVGPTGRLLYTSEASGLVARDESDSKSNRQASLQSSLMRGLVVDEDNRPVEGAALMVDSRPVFTDSRGIFWVRESKPRSHKLSVETDQFLDGGKWRVVSMPTSIRSSAQEAPAETVIVVSRIALKGLTGLENLEPHSAVER